METLEMYENNLGYKIIQRYLPSWHIHDSCAYFKTLVAALLVMISVWSMIGITICSTAAFYYLLLNPVQGVAASAVFFDIVFPMLTESGLGGTTSLVVAGIVALLGMLGVAISLLLIIGAIITIVVELTEYSSMKTITASKSVCGKVTKKVSSFTTVKLVKGWAGKYCVPVKIVKQGSKKK